MMMLLKVLLSTAAIAPVWVLLGSSGKWYRTSLFIVVKIQAYESNSHIMWSVERFSEFNSDLRFKEGKC